MTLRSRGEGVAGLMSSQLSAVSKSLVVDGGLGAVIRDHVGQQPRRLGLARIGTDEWWEFGGSGPRLTSAVLADAQALDLRADGARPTLAPTATSLPDCPHQR